MLKKKRVKLKINFIIKFKQLLNNFYAKFIKILDICKPFLRKWLNYRNCNQKSKSLPNPPEVCIQQ